MVGVLGFDAACLLAASIALIRGWTADRFASALVAVGMVAVVSTGTMFLGRGSRVAAGGLRAKEQIFTRGRLASGQTGHDWLEGRTAGPRPILIGGFVASLAVLATGMIVGATFGSS